MKYSRGVPKTVCYTDDDMTPDDTKFMRAAIEQSKISLASGDGPTGCVIVKDGEIIAAGHNEEHERCDPTKHAEMVTIQRLCQAVQKKHPTGCTLYSTLQPCGMCSVACLWTGIERIVYGASRGNVDSALFAEQHLNVSDYVHDSFHPNIEVVGGVLEAECDALYRTT